MIDRDHLMLTGVAVIAAVSATGLVGFAAYLYLSSERALKEMMALSAAIGSAMDRLETLVKAPDTPTGKDSR